MTMSSFGHKPAAWSLTMLAAGATLVGLIAVGTTAGPADLWAQESARPSDGISIAESSKGDGSAEAEQKKEKKKENEGERDDEQDDDQEDAGPAKSPDGLSIPTVEVTGESGSASPPRSLAEPTESMDADFLERRDVGDLAEAMAWMSSASTVEDTGARTGMIVEGLPPAQFEIVENGLPVGRPTIGPNGPAQNAASVDLSGRDVERVELHRGLGPLGSGPASGVVASIEEAPLPDRAGFAVDLQGRMPATHFERPYYTVGRASGRVHAAAGDDWAFQATGGADSRQPVDVNRDGVDDLPRRLRYRAGLQSQWHPDGRTSTDADGLDLKLSFDQTETEAAVGADTPLKDVVRMRRAAAQAVGDWSPAAAWTVEHRSQLDFFGHRFRKRVRSSGFERPMAHTRQFRAIQDVSARRLVGFHELGAEIYGSYTGLSREGEAGELEPVDRLHGGLSVADIWMPREDVEVAMRLWGEVHSQFGPGWMGEVSAGWQALEWLAVRGSAARTRRLPTSEELYLFFDHSDVGYQVQGNPNLEPETMWSGRVGGTLGHRDWPLTLDVGGFYHRLEDLINASETVDERDGLPVFAYENVASADTAGLNARLTVPEVVAGLRLRASYSFLPLARNLGTGERLDLRTAHRAVAELSRPWLDERLRTWVDLRTRAAMEVPSDSPAAPAYLLLGLGARWKGEDGFGARLDVDNLLDQTNATWGPKPGLTVMLSLSYRYLAGARAP